MNDKQSGLMQALAAAGLASGDVSERARKARVAFLRDHADAVYDALTGNRSRFVRIGELVEAAARQFPGLVPDPKDIAAEEGLRQSQKAGLEIDQGLFLSAILGSKQSGPHLCQAMLLPKPESVALLPKFEKDGALELPGGSIERRGKAAYVTYRNPRFLNAEDQTSLAGMETCVDLALLDPKIEVAVLRGMPVEHPKYQGRTCLWRRHQPHASLSRPHPVPLVPRARSRLRQQALSRAGARRRCAAGRVRRPDHREAVDRRGGILRHRRPLPDPARGRLRDRGEVARS